MKNRLELYLKNCCVALVSAKHFNPDSDVALVTNIDVPSKFKSLLEAHDIKIIKAPFEEFVFPDGYLWSLAFYKLAALSYVLTHYGYKRVAYMDSDVYVQSSFDNIWRECDESIMLYDINHGLQVKDYRIIVDEFASFLKEEKLITHYGGEFYASNRENGLRFIEEAKKIHKQMIDEKFVTTKGDEFILSVAASRMKESIKNAGAYVYRFWTGAAFHLISTCYEFNSVAVLHVPSEKKDGMLTLYRTIEKGKIPSNKTVWKKLHLYKPRTIGKVKVFIKATIRR